MHMLMLRTQTHIFPLCYLRISVIVHMQCRLNKHFEQKNKRGVVEGGGFSLKSTNKSQLVFDQITMSESLISHQFFQVKC